MNIGAHLNSNVGAVLCQEYRVMPLGQEYSVCLVSRVVREEFRAVATAYTKEEADLIASALNERAGY